MKGLQNCIDAFARFFRMVHGAEDIEKRSVSNRDDYLLPNNINMKRIIYSYQSLRLILLFVLGAVIFHNPALCQDTDATECPYFNVSSTDSTGVIFSLLSTNVDATISGVIANVEVEQLYVNAGDSIVDATYVFPMSTQAAIYGMEMDVNDRTIVAEIRRKEEAQEIFDNADSTGLTATLLEQHRPNVFQMSIANINPGDSITVRMVYTELLIPVEGVYQFVFPTIVGPRFTTGGEPWVYQTFLDAVPLSETDFNVDVKINAGMSVSADCITHDVTFENSTNSTHTSLSTNPGTDFILNYTLDDSQIETGLLLYEGEEENFFLSMVQPAKPGVTFRSPPREYVFIMDVSGSMTGMPLEISKELIIDLLEDLDSEDKFNIITFAGGSDQLAPNSLPVSIDNIDLAIEFVNNVSASGGTHILPAIDKALQMQGTNGFSRSFVIITDGFVTVEKQAFELIRENLNEANFFSFGISSNVNRFIIEGIAYVGEGEPFIVTEYDEADEIAQTFKRYIEKPVLTNIEANFEGIEVYDLEPYSIPDVFAERPIILYGKYHKPAVGKVEIKGDYGDEELVSTLNFEEYSANNEENIALKYLWARKKIKLMSDYGIASNESDTLTIEEEITQLGLKYSLITDYTSFVAVDSSAIATNSDTDNSSNDDGGLTEVDNIVENIASSRIMEVVHIVTNAQKQLRVKLLHPEILELKHLSVQLVSLEGKIIYQGDLKELLHMDEFLVPINNVASGIYLVSLVSEDGVVATEKFLVQY